jgi:acyl-ACP thioesterase
MKLRAPRSADCFIAQYRLRRNLQSNLQSIDCLKLPVMPRVKRMKKGAFMQHIFSRDFKLRYFEMNKHGMASPITILTLLEEAAADHCHTIGHSLYSLERQNIGWVLVSGSITMSRYPKYKETIKIQTWISKFSLVKGHRENVITDNIGRVIGKAKGIWVFYDIQNRKPVPIFDDIKTKWGIDPNVSTEIDTNLINPIAMKGRQDMEFDVCRSDVDNNKHVNNIRYFHWLIESLPDEILDRYLLETINARFYSDAKYGEKIQVYVDGNLENNTFRHTMKSDFEDKLFAVAHTRWKKMTARMALTESV